MRLTSTLILVLLLASTTLAEVTAFPTIKGRTLAGTERTTEALRGKPHLVAIGFERGHAGALRRWAEGFRTTYPDPQRADYLEIAAMSGVPSFLRGYISKQMSKDVPESERSKVLVTYSTDDLCKKLEIKDRKQVHVYLLNPQGSIIDRAQGDFDAEVVKRFQTRLQRPESSAK